MIFSQEKLSELNEEKVKEFFNLRQDMAKLEAMQANQQLTAQQKDQIRLAYQDRSQSILSLAQDPELAPLIHKHLTENPVQPQGGFGGML